MEPRHNKTVALIIVTYNRLNLLRNCLDSIYEQSYKNFDIIVINNGSTDGTKEFLDTQKDIIAINQENVGGAGGFYSGMKYMYEHKYEWLWMMDDDGIADKNQLRNLLKAGKKYKFLNAIVIDKDNHDKFAFLTPKATPEIAEITRYPIIESFVHPFNGTFIHRSIIEKIGFIKKEMFIWGDEQEYVLRAKRAGFKPVTVTNAIHYHPKEKGVKVNAFPFIKNKFIILIKPSKLSHIYYRNQGFIHKNYYDAIGWYIGFKFLTKYTVYFLRTFKIKELLKVYIYYFRGRNNKF